MARSRIAPILREYSNSLLSFIRFIADRIPFVSGEGSVSLTKRFPRDEE